MLPAEGVVDEGWGQGSMRLTCAGLEGLTGAAMESRSAAVLAERGVDTGDFEAQRITASLVDEAAMILTMTRRQRSALLKQWPAAMKRSFTVADFVHLGGFVGDDQLPARTNPDEWVREVADLVNGQRGLHAPLNPEEADIDDPFGRDDAVHEAMVTRLDELLPGLARLLGA